MAILAGFIATFLLGGWMTLNGTLNVGAYGVLVFLTQRLLWPLTSLAETVDLYERAMASSRRILDLIETPVAIGTTAMPGRSATCAAGSTSSTSTSLMPAANRCCTTST